MIRKLSYLLLALFAPVCFGAGAYTPGMVLVTEYVPGQIHCQGDFNVRFNTTAAAAGNIFIGGGDGNSIGVFCTDSRNGTVFFCAALQGDAAYDLLNKHIYAPTNGTTLSVVARKSDGKCLSSAFNKASSKLN